MRSNNGKRVVITGIGVITPIGCTVTSMWQGLISGKLGIRPISSFDTSQYKTKYAAEIKDFNPLDNDSGKAASRMDRFTQFAVAAR